MKKKKIKKRWKKMVIEMNKLDIKEIKKMNKKLKKEIKNEEEK